MKSRGWEKTSTQMLTLSLSSLLLCLPTMSPSDIQFQPPLTRSLSPSFCCLSNVSPGSPLMPPLHLLLLLTPSLISCSLHTFCLSLSSPLLFPSPPLLSTPTHSWYSTDLSGQLYNRSAEKGALLTLKAALYGQQCMQHDAAVRLCVDFTGLARGK